MKNKSSLVTCASGSPLVQLSNSESTTYITNICHILCGLQTLSHHDINIYIYIYIHIHVHRYIQVRMCICSVTKYTYVHTHNIMCVYVIYIHMDLYVHISGVFSLRSQIGGIRIFVASISFPFFSYFVLASVCLICLIVCLFVRQYHGRVLATEL